LSRNLRWGGAAALDAPVLRLDVLFAGNLVISFLLFWFAGWISWLRPRWWRLLLTAGLGASLALAPVLTPWGRWLLSGPGLAIASVLLTFLLAWPCSVRQWWAAFGGLWVAVGAAGGGALLLAASRELEPPAGFRLSGLWVTVGVALALAGLWVVWQGYRERRAVTEAIRRIRIRMGEEEVQISALVDSGNSLCTPVGRQPVAVVEAGALGPCLAPAIREAVERGWSALDELPEEWRSRCQLVPYSAVGSLGKALLAVAPDELSLWDEVRGGWVSVGGVIGLSTQSLDPQGRYRALLPLMMLQEVQGK